METIIFAINIRHFSICLWVWHQLINMATLHLIYEAFHRQNFQNLTLNPLLKVLLHHSKFQVLVVAHFFVYFFLIFSMESLPLVKYHTPIPLSLPNYHRYYQLKSLLVHLYALLHFHLDLLHHLQMIFLLHSHR